jgi:general stress protein 26
MTYDDRTGTVAEIMEATDIAVLTYVSLDGALVSTPMGTQDFEDPGTTWFITERSSDKVRALEADPRVNVSACAFMSGGPEDPDNVLLRIDGETAEYWESPGKVGAAIQMAKGLVTDSEPDLGDNDTVAL